MKDRHVGKEEGFSKGKNLPSRDDLGKKKGGKRGP